MVSNGVTSVEQDNGRATSGERGAFQQVPPSEEVQEPQQEMDLNVYEDDDDETLHRKLIAAKIARKRAEEDHRLLSNRIALLKQEEQKVPPLPL